MQKLILMTLLAAGNVAANPWFDGSPDYADDASRRLAAELLDAHGGMQPMAAAESLQFNFFTKMIGGPMPFYSFEATDLDTGNGYLEWPFWQSRVGWVDGDLWSHEWPMPMPAGFFIRLTTSFITLPWQINADSANVGPVSTGRLPDDDNVYDVLHVTFDDRNPSIPGTFYDIFVDPDTRRMKGIRFDINHPGMVSNPTQPLGPNYHVFGEYRQVGGLTVPTFYKSFGAGSANGGTSNAYHFAWNIRLDQPFDRDRLEAPEGAVRDAVSMEWWGSTEDDSKGASR